MLCFTLLYQCVIKIQTQPAASLFSVQTLHYRNVSTGRCWVRMAGGSGVGVKTSIHSSVL